MIRTLGCIALAAGALFAWPHPAQAAQSYDNCTGFITSLPATISTQGTWCLNQNLLTFMRTGNAITIASNNVTIDCNHFRISGVAHFTIYGLPSGLDTQAIGIRADTRLNATVRNCNIHGFFVGILSLGGAGHLIEHSRLSGNTFSGIYTESPGSTIRNNLVSDTGGTTVIDGTVGIHAMSGVDVIDNTVIGVGPTGTDLHVYGISTTQNGDGSISGNRVRGLAPTGSGQAYGIYTADSGHGVISDNHVLGPGPGVVGGIGVRCSTSGATARGNVIVGFETAIDTCFSSSNAVNPN